ncbi:MAG: glycosyltransferase [Peptococcaceae bacterium]|nr:glycosyltransferase [Peptococcaceae bacterium]
MIFVVLGSRMFQFDRLLKEIDNLIEKGVIKDTVFAQIGSSTYRPRNYAYKEFLDQAEFKTYIEQADIIITHAGTGSIITSLQAGKTVIAVARLKQYHEVVDDHQLEIVRKFSEMGMVIGVENVAQLETTLLKLDAQHVNQFVSNTQHIIGLIEDFIGKQVKKV